MGQHWMTVLGGRTGGGDGRAVRGAGHHDVVGHGANDFGGIEGPPIAGDLVIGVPADKIIHRLRDPGGTQAVGHALKLVEIALRDLVLMKAHRLLTEPVIGHAVDLKRHVLVDPLGVGILVGEQIPFLKATFIGGANDLHMMPAIDIFSASLLEHFLLLNAHLTHRGLFCIGFNGFRWDIYPRFSQVVLLITLKDPLHSAATSAKTGTAPLSTTTCAKAHAHTGLRVFLALGSHGTALR